MKLTDYIRGDRRGKDANSFEKEAMDDEFLSDAIEGYDAVYGDHIGTLNRLENWVGQRAARRKQARIRKIIGISAAAAVVLIAGGLAFFRYAGYTPSEHTVAELLVEENPKTYISPPEFRSEIEPSAAPIAAADLRGNMVAEAETAAPPDAPGTKAAEETAPAAVTALSDNTIKLAAASAPESKEPKPGAEKHITAKQAPEANKEPARAATPVTEPEDGIPAIATRATATRASAGEEKTDTLYNESFTRYFIENRRPKTDSLGRAQYGKILVEFRVNDIGVPSAIRVLSSFSREANRELIEMLVEGPRWEPTHGRRVRTIVEYEKPVPPAE